MDQADATESEIRGAFLFHERCWAGSCSPESFLCLFSFPSVYYPSRSESLEANDSPGCSILITLRSEACYCAGFWGHWFMPEHHSHIIGLCGWVSFSHSKLHPYLSRAEADNGGCVLRSGVVFWAPAPSEESLLMSGDKRSEPWKRAFCGHLAVLW